MLQPQSACAEMLETPPPVQVVGVVGAGMMGRGIARRCLRAGLTVCLHDADQVVAEQSHRELSAEFASQPATNIRLARTVADFAEADLVVEAISENLAQKQTLLGELESVLRPTAIIATNTSSFPVSQLAERLQRPEQLCGTHFCHPVDQRSLVELVCGRQTSGITQRRAKGFLQQLQLQAIKVGDGPGFVLNRLLAFYLNEALDLLLDGAAVDSLDEVAVSIGMPAGPLVQLDEFGLDVALAVGRTLYIAFPDRWRPSELLVAVYKAQVREGRTQCSFLMPRDQVVDQPMSAKLEPTVRRLMSERGRSNRKPTRTEIERRLRLTMLLEATRIWDEGLVADPLQIDRILQLGLGMSDSFRGLIGWCDQFGARNILEWLEPFQSLGGRFTPTSKLLEAASSGSPEESEQGIRMAA